MTIRYRMREDWDARARQDAMYFIDSRRTAWDMETFFAEGRAEALALIRPRLARLSIDPAGRRFLEIGCGIGRLFPGFAELFDEVWGVDVSEVMIQKGRELCPVGDARFVLGTGQDLSGIAAEYVDYCFSYIVFQHLPDTRVLWRYLKETHRVLKPGGAFQLHFRASTSLKSTLLRRLPLRVRLAVQRLRGRRLPGESSTWTGVSVQPGEVETRLAALGFQYISIEECKSFAHRSFWAIGRKA